MQEISRFYGIIIQMFFNDHNPPHFHAVYQGYKISVTIDDGIVEGKMPKRALRLIFEWLELHKDALAQNWEMIKETGEFNTIEPLK